MAVWWSMRQEEHDACGVGFLADLAQKASHDVVRLALEAVGAMEHRGARAADGRTGDGAGILIETPRALLQRELAAAHVRVPDQHLAAVCVFLPRAEELAAAMRARIEHAIRSEGVKPMRWRVPPVDPAVLGAQAAATAPSYEQLLVDVGPGNARERMRSVRRTVIRTLREENDAATLVSASTTKVVYKGLLSSSELGAYFADLRDPACTSRYATFHQRFSTNTAPSWALVQPFGTIAHNGEIDTITGNRAWMRARGIVSPRGASDSLEFDVAVDAMVGAGYRVDEAVDFMLSPAVEDDDDRLRAYYDAHVPTVEPWDGPAAIVFAEGDRVGAALDRSGFRPLRWCRTESGKVLAASETGVVDFGADEIVERGRLGPGERITVRFATGELIRPEAFRAFRRHGADFRATVQSWRFEPPADITSLPPQPEALRRDLVRFGYTKDELLGVVGPLADGTEATSSMGDDAALPFLERRMPVTEYLRQRFAQVTNPPIDALREGFVFDMRAWVGSGATNGDVPAPGSIVTIESALLEEGAFDALAYDTRLITHRIALDCAQVGLRARVTQIADEAERMVGEGASYLVLDDRHAALPVPAILAAGAIHQRLTDKGLRMQASIAACDGAARDAHACAALIAAGANVVTPWLAARASIAQTGSAAAYLDALRAGLVKILAKLGICTLRSYVGAQTFEALGLRREIVATCFPGMAVHVQSLGFDELEEDLRAWDALAREATELPQRGLFRYRRDGVRHSFDPPLLKNLRKTIVARDEAAFYALSDALEARPAITLARPRRAGRDRRSDRAGRRRARRGHPQALRHRRDVAWCVGARSARGGRARRENRRRAQQRRRGRRGPDAHAQRDQASRVGALRRVRRLPRDGRRAGDQDRARREARRRRPDPGLQGDGGDRCAARRRAGAVTRVAAAAPRHLLDRRSRAAHLRLAPRESESEDRGQAGRTIGHRVRRQRCRESVGRRRARRGPRRRHRRVAARFHQTRRLAVGAGTRRNAPHADGQRIARPREAARGRRLQERPRRGARIDARRRHVRFRQRAARRARLHLRAAMPPEHMPGRHRDAGRRAARQVPRQCRGRGDVLALRRARRAAAARRAGRARRSR